MTRQRALLALLLAVGVAGCAALRERFPGPDVPFVATPENVTREMLKIAAVTPEDTVFDLGSGDGRVVIAAARDFGAHGVGVEIDPNLVNVSRDAALAAGVGARVMFLWQDLFVTDLTGATVVTIYLNEEVNLKLRPKLLRELAPGARVVSHQFDMGDWAPELVHDVRGRERGYRLYLWLIPARADGAWRSRVADGEPVRLTLTQQLQKLGGTLGAQPLTGRVRGERVEINAGALTLRGVARGDRIEGEAVTAGGAAQRWTAERAQN